IPVCTVANDYTTPFILADGSGGAFLCWQDRRSGDIDIYGQHVLANGSFECVNNGQVICNAPELQLMYVTQGDRINGGIVSDNNGGFVVTWQDYRDFRVGTITDIKVGIYATKVFFVTPTPIILDVNDNCASSPTAKGKLANPPSGATITITQDGVPLSYSPSDSSFQYFTSGITTIGSHTVLVKYLAGCGSREKDTAYAVLSNNSPVITISASSTNVCAGSTVNFTDTTSGARTSPVYQWTINGNNVGNNSASYSSSSIQNGDVIKCVIALNPSLQCASTFTAESNNITMTVSVTAAPSVTITSSANDICPGEPVQFTANTINCGASPSYQWKLNGVQVGNNTASYSNNTPLNNDRIICIV